MNNNGSKSNQKGDNGNYQKYVGAPYNFVSLPKSIVTRRNKESELPDHQKILEVSGEDKMYSGEIEYSIVPQTDIFVGGVTEKNKDGKEIQKFYQAADGTYAIPGSTVRGLLRTNTQILGLGSIDDDVEDNKMMYRKVAGTKENLLNTYKNTMNGKGKKGSQYDGVRAGYIECRNGQYYIYQPGRELDEELPKEIIPEKEPSEAEIEENEFPEDVPEKDKFPEIELSKEAIEENKFPEDAPEKDKFPEIELSEEAIEEEGTPDNELSKSEDSELEDFLAVSEEPVAETPDNKTPTADEVAVKDLPESKSVAVTAKFSPEEEDLLKLPEEEASSEKKIVIEEPAPVPEKKRNPNIEILEEILAELENGGKKR